MLISEGLFAAANIFSNLKLVYIFSVNPYLGPLQVSLSRMVMDILKFMTLFILVLFAFSCGKNLSKHLIIVPVRFSKARKISLWKISLFCFTTKVNFFSSTFDFFWILFNCFNIIDCLQLRRIEKKLDVKEKKLFLVVKQKRGIFFFRLFEALLGRHDIIHDIQAWAIIVPGHSAFFGLYWWGITCRTATLSFTSE